MLIPIHYDMGLRSMAKIMITQVSDSIDKLKDAMKAEGCDSELVILEEGGSYS